MTEAVTPEVELRMKRRRMRPRSPLGRLYGQSCVNLGSGGENFVELWRRHSQIVLEEASKE